MKVFFDDVQRAHVPRFFLQRGLVRANYETAARTDALLAACRLVGLQIEAPPALRRETLEAVHSAEYLDFLRDAPAAWAALPEHGPELVPNIHPSPEMLANGARRSATVIGQLGWFTADTSCPIAAETWPAAAAAAACAVAAAAEAVAGRHAYALTRPPGHHAYAARAGGHCYLNNAAIAAERMRATGLRRIGILDIDSHHGNGTQGIFWRRDDVMVVSVHGDPNGYYPWYVGHAGERGEGPGAGWTLNMPLPQGTRDEGWLRAIDLGLRDIAAAHVDALVLSLGFDASKDEPLGFLGVTEDGFGWAGALVRRLGVPVAIVQEGGYNTEIIGGLLLRFLDGLTGHS